MIEMEKLLAAQKASLEEFTKQFGTDMEAKLLKVVDGRLVPVSDQIKTVGDAYADLKKQYDALATAVAARTTGVLPGLGDEIEKNGAINITEAVPGLPSFNKNSRSYAMAKEYTEKVRDLTAGTDSEGGILVSTQMLPGFIEAARARAVVWDPALITVYDNLSGTPVDIPKETGNTTVYWVGENEAPTKSAVTFGQVRFTPKKAAAQVRISNRLLRLANGAMAEQVTRRNLARSFGLEIDRVLLRGAGASNEPRGIVNTPGIKSVAIGTNGGDFSFAVAWDMVAQLEAANTFEGRLAYVGHPLAFHKMRKERIKQYSGDTLGAYVILPMSDANIRQLLGFDFRKTTTIPSNLTKGSGTSLSEVYFGNWEDVLLGLWQNIEFRASDVTGDNTGSAMLMDQTWLYAFLECDVQMAKAESMVLVNDAATV